MVALYVTSPEGAVGKTAICAGLGRHLLNDGKKVGFLKPLMAGDKPVEGTDSDAIFMKQVLTLEEPADQMCPVIDKASNLVDSIRDAYARVSAGKDVVIVEGLCGLGSGDVMERASYAIAEALCARVIIVERYNNQLSPGAFIGSYVEFGEFLLGVVLNEVPINRLEQVREEASARFGEAGIKILGVLPEDRTLFALTVAEIARHIQGEIVDPAEKSSELVENILLGAKQVDPGPEYFSRKTSKAVVVRSDRPDMQLAALETPTTCLVLSGDTPPIPTVLYNAEATKVPIISTDADIISIVSNIEDALNNARFNQDKKLARLGEIMEQHFDFPALYRELKF